MATYMYIKLQENSISYNTPSKSITRLKDKLVGDTVLTHDFDIHRSNTSESSDYTRDPSSCWPQYLALMNHINRTGVHNYTGMAYTYLTSDEIYSNRKNVTV